MQLSNFLLVGLVLAVIGVNLFLDWLAPTLAAHISRWGLSEHVERHVRQSFPSLGSRRG